MAKFKILFAASEVVPFAKTGGLADVAGALPKVLTEMGHDVRIVMPKYRLFNEDNLDLKELCRLSIKMGNETETAIIKTANMPGTKIKVYFVQNDKYYDRDQLYATKNGEYPDNLARFGFYCRAMLEMIPELRWVPQIIHCNDWHTALVPVYLKTVYNKGPYDGISTVYTIHNMAYQGIFPSEQSNLTYLDKKIFKEDGLEFWGRINLMKGGIIFSDVINTVSEKYSEEIKSGEEYGFGLEGLVRNLDKKLYGIVNGVDYEEWSPEKDQFISENYSLATIRKKKRVKEALQKTTGLSVSRDIPLIGLISRLTDQKGLDILAEVINEIMEKDVQLILLGYGEKKYHKMFESLADKVPDRVSVNLKFDNQLAHFIYAGADIFLMPSRFEPCGLGQLISFRYGTIPIVRATGGLADTVIDFSKGRTANGFSFMDYSSKALLATLTKALDIFKDKKSWANLVINAMEADFSWQASAKKYVKLYEIAIK